MDETVARWARIHAAQLDMSLSRMLGDVLTEMMHQEEGYRSAMQHALSRELRPLSAPGTAYPTRDQLHDRFE